MQRPAAEWLCDYGETIPRVLAAMLFVYVLFIAVYYSANAVRVSDGGVTREWTDLAVFSLLAMTTSGNAAAGLAVHHGTVTCLPAFRHSSG